MGERAGRGANVRAFAALALCSAAAILFNALFVPSMRSVFEFGGDVATLVSVVLFSVLAVLSYYRPDTVRYGFVALIVVVLTVAALPLAFVGFQAMRPFVLVVAATFFYVTAEGGFLLALMGCCSILPEQRLLVTVAAVGAGYILSWGCALLPFEVAVLLSLCLPLASLPFSQPMAREVFCRVNESEPAVTARIASPRAMLPFAHGLFLVLLFLQIAFGYSVIIENGVSATVGPLVLMAALLVAAQFGSRWLDLDTLLRIELFLVIMSFVALGQGSFPFDGIASMLLGCMNCVYLIFFIASLSAAAASNPATALTVFAWGWSLSEVGIVLGANLAFWVPTAMRPWAMFALAAAFLVLGLFGLRRLSIERAVRDIVEPAVGNVRGLAEDNLLDDSSLEGRCAVVAKRFGLTAREAEIMGLLAQGRNGVRIQEALVITRNTYKTHIRHIYEKMDVHDQQEVIDLVQGIDG